MSLFSFINNNKRPWEKFYNKNERKVDIPNVSLYEFIYDRNKYRLNNIAINYLGTKINYRDFFNEIDLCAKAMRSQGIRAGDVVSICLPNMPESVIVFYAVSKIVAIANMIHPLSAVE